MSGDRFLIETRKANLIVKEASMKIDGSLARIWNGPFGHAGGFGYQSSDRSGLQLLGHRYYDPETGRFLTRDPIKDGNNWHAYGGGINNPIMSYDAEGLKNEVLPHIRKGIAEGDLPGGTAERYQKDKKFRENIHREIAKRKPKTPKEKNPDLSHEEIVDVVKDELEKEPEPGPSRPSRKPNRKPNHSTSIDWQKVGTGAAVVIAIGAGVAAIIITGGGATPLVGAVAAGALGGVILRPPTSGKPNGGG